MKGKNSIAFPEDSKQGNNLAERKLRTLQLNEAIQDAQGEVKRLSEYLSYALGQSNSVEDINNINAVVRMLRSSLQNFKRNPKQTSDKLALLVVFSGRLLQFNDDDVEFLSENGIEDVIQNFKVEIEQSGLGNPNGSKKS
ncbi:hypothetical protein GF376_02690 [Candidatus Peregrinibacteria bacterium]|nr:hypothetical protein [Candidatus Peregrinibacteria bacterium]